ncbi:hypothetical protein MMC07_000847 [Pseudocyphellaria aurata]|nr:hypothetical protein [Pseudocyphellaria aurata]
MAKNPERPQLGFRERLGFTLILFRALSTTSLTLLASPLRGKSGAPDLYKHVYYHAIRSINARASARQLQSVFPSTEECYRNFAATNGFPPETVALAFGAKAHWLGDRSAHNILLFFHGGGYIYPATKQFDFLWCLKESVSDDLAVVVLQYSLAPGGQYPLQLRQGVELLRHIIHDADKKASNVILGGDSAGGNLALGVLSHLLHPHSSIQALALSEPLKGVIFLSPWVGFQMTAPSYTRNQQKDLVGVRGLKKSASFFMGEGKTDEYNQPSCAEAEWWQGLKDVVGEIFITAGADELMVDDIEAISEKIKAVHPKTSTLITPGEGHDLPIMDRAIGWKVESLQEKAAKAWLAELQAA